MQATKKLLSFVLALVMVLGAVVAVPFTVGAEAWDGTTVTKPEGKGTKEEPYLIASAANLAWISQMTENYRDANDALKTSFTSDQVFADTYFVQTADIDLGGKDFTPIGTTQATSESKRNAFAGHYDGRSYKISNAVIKVTSKVTSVDYGTIMTSGYKATGLFGVLDRNAVVCNINACNIKAGTLDQSQKSAVKAYNALVSGVIAGTTFGAATIVNCTTDADCEAYGAYAAGGIMGMSENGASITECVNNATVSGNLSSGGIIGYGHGASISYCINNGAVIHFTFSRWSGSGGIIGAPISVSANTSCSISYCINTADAKVGAISGQAGGSGSNRVAVGGIVGNDNASASTVMVYSYCYNLQEKFDISFYDNGNTASNCLVGFGGIAGYARDGAGGGTRTMQNCYTVAAEYTENDFGTKKVYAGNFNPQANGNAGAINTAPYAGLMCAALSDAQVTGGWGDINTVFSTCKYGVTANELTADTTYQSILELAAVNAAYAKAPKYVGVQETSARGDAYALRFIVATKRTDYFEAGVKVVATYGEAQTAEYTIKADKYYQTLTGMKNGSLIEYKAEDFGGTHLMALTQKIDLATMGAVSYTVTPYFIETEGGETAYGRTWTILYDATGVFNSQSIMEVIEEDDTDLFTLVYPLISANAAVYPIITLQNHIYGKSGILLARKTRSSSKTDAYEIVSKEVEGMATGAYELKVENNRLYILASDAFGFIGAANHLIQKTFMSGKIALSDACNAKGTYGREMLAEKAGEVRVILQNAWFRDNSGALFNTPTSYQYQLSLVMTYMPDVIGLNEFQPGWRGSGFTAAMEQQGYIEVKPKNASGQEVNTYNPIFYNKETTEYVEGSCRYLSYGSFQSTDTDEDGIREPVLRTEGEFAGRYWDNSDNRGSTAVVATFKNKETGEYYSVCCTHLESNTLVDPQVAPLGNPLRWEQVEKLIPFLNAYQQQYGAPVIMGGDMNSNNGIYKPGTYSALGGSIEIPEDMTFKYHTGEEINIRISAMKMLEDAGYVNCATQTTNTSQHGSCNGYPNWSDALGAYVSYNCNLADTSGDNNSIDHIYALDLENKVEELVYRTLTLETILCSSDHKPVMLDFNLN